MSEQTYSDVVSTARDYYNSDDADNFYATIWGGEDIHIGLYETPEEDIATASRRTVQTMADLLPSLTSESQVLDIGAGFGGAARYLAKRFGCSVVALNLSEKENERDRAMNAEQGLSDKIKVVDASFEAIPYPDGSFDAVWSQDAILHSGNREAVVKEVARVLKPGGVFIFTDILETEVVPAGALQPVYDRIHLTNLGSLAFYETTAENCGMTRESFQDHTNQLITHYGRVHDETEARKGELDGVVSSEYIEKMKIGLQHWVDAGTMGYLQWGIQMFRKT